MARKTKKVEIESDRDSLADEIAGILNKSNKDGGNIAFVLGDDLDDDPSKIIDWVPSGNDQLDIIMANRPNAGYPVGRITELTGLEGSGKTLLSMHALAETQKKGGLAVFIDTESSLDVNFVKAIGVDVNKLLYVSCDTVEEIFDCMETLVEKVRKANKDRLVTIVVDSVAAASCKTEMEADHGKDGYATAKAIIISKAMRKITQMIARQRVCVLFTNQLRVKMNAMFGDPYTTSGGKALAFHASLRLRLQAVGQIKDAKKNTIGIKTRCKIIKNRMGPPMRNIDFDLFYDRGLDNYGNWLDTLKENKIVSGTRTPYDYTKDNGDVVKIPKAELTQLLSGDEELRDELYGKLCDIHIMKYKDQSQCESDDIEYDDSVEEVVE
jgi:recombination protein RecA